MDFGKKIEKVAEDGNGVQIEDFQEIFHGPTRTRRLSPIALVFRERYVLLLLYLLRMRVMGVKKKIMTSELSLIKVGLDL